MICNDSQRLGPVLRLREPGDGGGAGHLARAGDPPQPRPHRQADGGEGEQPEVIMMRMIVMMIMMIMRYRDLNRACDQEQARLGRESVLKDNKTAEIWSKLGN